MCACRERGVNSYRFLVNLNEFAKLAIRVLKLETSKECNKIIIKFLVVYVIYTEIQTAYF